MHTVILAGGKGTRLRPYTTVFPKPLMPLGDLPILEVVIRQLRAAGCDGATLAVGHLAELLMAFFGDGSRWGLPIDYLREEQPLGTVGALGRMPAFAEPFLLMNGDVLTTLDYRVLLEHHRRQGGIATIAMHERNVRIDLGVIEHDPAGRITGYIEKPTHVYHVSMGIYVFEPRVREYIMPGERLDFPDLVLRLLAAGERVMSYPFTGYWLDIGRPDDYEQAVAEFDQLRHLLLPDDTGAEQTERSSV
jgi:NDP-sugar pyrophosphorylase family protein